MVLFTERETLLLLDMYLRLLRFPENTSPKGIVLKPHARAQLTRAINHAAIDHKDRVWTEGQVFVKFKNLRVDYSLVKWIQEQPGFHGHGDTLPNDWWLAIKAQRPKAYVFKDKLPWPFYSRMAKILHEDAPNARPIPTDAATERHITELLNAAAAETATATATAAVSNTINETADESTDEISNSSSDDNHVAIQAAVPEPVQRRVVASVQQTPPTTLKRPRVAPVAPVTPPVVAERPSPVAAKRSRNSLNNSSRASSSPAQTRSHHHALSWSVEQCAAAATAMAHSFQDLVAVFQAQSDKVRDVEEARVTSNSSSDTDDLLVAERQVLLSIARSLEKSSQASADMARGYHDLIEHYVREAESQRLQ